jgi:hypothetical protein
MRNFIREHTVVDKSATTKSFCKQHAVRLLAKIETKRLIYMIFLGFFCIV